jgi:hypothetical protein
MSPRAKLRLWLVAASVFLAATGLARAAEAHALPTPSGTLLQNATWLSKNELAIAPLSQRVALAGRADVGLGRAGLALGATALDVSPKTTHATRLGVELKADRGYGGTGTPVETYLGPELSLGTKRTHATLGYMFDVSDARNAHAQLGLGLGF